MTPSRVLVASTVAIAFAGCVLGEYKAGDADGTPAPAADSGTSGMRGSDGQAGPSDATPSDAETVGDAKVEGGSLFDAGAPPDCHGDDMLFCATFEDASLLPSGWSYGDPSKTTLVKGSGRTTPGGALCKVTSATAVAGAWLRVSEYAPNNRKLLVRVSFAVDDVRESGTILSLELGTALSVAVAVDTAGALHGSGHVSDSPVLPVTRSTLDAAPGQWHELGIELDIQGGKLTSTLDGTEFLAPLTFAGVAEQGSTNVTMFLGGFDEDDGTPLNTPKRFWPTTRFDDVSALMAPAG